MDKKTAFDGIATETLLAIARGEISATALARKTLAARGIDQRTGKATDMATAKRAAGLYATRGPAGRIVYVSIPK